MANKQSFTLDSKPLLLMDLPAQDIAITPGALDASTATDDSVFLRAMLPTCVPPAYWHKYEYCTSIDGPLRFCPHLRLISRELARAYQSAVQSKDSSPSSPVPALSSCSDCD